MRQFSNNNMASHDLGILLSNESGKNLYIYRLYLGHLNENPRGDKFKRKVVEL